jgi:hypothetical protein
MARFKPVRDRKKPSSTRGLIPCLVLIISGIVLMSLFFYFMLRSSGS